MLWKSGIWVLKWVRWYCGWSCFEPCSGAACSEPLSWISAGFHLDLLTHDGAAGWWSCSTYCLFSSQGVLNTSMLKGVLEHGMHLSHHLWPCNPGHPELLSLVVEVHGHEEHGAHLWPLSCTSIHSVPRPTSLLGCLGEGQVPVVSALLRSACVCLSVCLCVHVSISRALLGGGGRTRQAAAWQGGGSGDKNPAEGTMTAFLEAEKTPGSLPSSSSVCSGRTKPRPPAPTQCPGIRRKPNLCVLPLSPEPGSSSASALPVPSPRLTDQRLFQEEPGLLEIKGKQKFFLGGETLCTSGSRWLSSDAGK